MSALPLKDEIVLKADTIVACLNNELVISVLVLGSALYSETVIVEVDE